MIESLKFEVKDNGDTGVASSVVLIGDSGSWASRRYGVEGDNEDDHALLPPFKVGTDALRIWSKSAVAALRDRICWWLPRV